MAGELSRLARRAGIRDLPEPKKAGTGSLIYPFDPLLAVVATRYHRTSSRVVWNLYESQARRLEPLHDEWLADIRRDDRKWHFPGTFRIRARNVVEFEASAGQVVGAVKAAVEAGTKLTLELEQSDILLALRQHDDTLTLSLDLTGMARHLRGYRREGGEAPLRENLAACLVMLTRWDARSEALIDPMAGSGTIPIEAALMARGIPVCDPPLLKKLPALAAVDAPTGALFGDTQPALFANEIHTPLIEEIKAAAARAGCDRDITVHHGDFKTWPLKPPREQGVILVNPPYGGRLAVDDELSLYHELGRFCRGFPGYRAGILVANLDFKAAFFGGRPRISKPLANASERAYFYLYDF
jgi:23S rRNA G2445 N2-methylase RlmL